MIPLSKTSHRPHRCKAKPFNRGTRRQWWHEQQRKAEQTRQERQRKEEKQKQYYHNFQEQLKQKNYYQILGIQPAAGCTEQELKDVFRKKMLEFHPDRNHSPDAHEQTIKIIEAYEKINLEISK